jgi:hypothetical protein
MIDAATLDYLHHHEPLFVTFFLLMGGLNGLASALEGLVEVLPTGKKGCLGNFIGFTRAFAKVLQYFLQGMLAKRFRDEQDSRREQEARRREQK